MWLICEMVYNDAPIIINKRNIIAVYPRYDEEGDECGSCIEVVNADTAFYVKEPYNYIERILCP